MAVLSEDFSFKMPNPNIDAPRFELFLDLCLMPQQIRLGARCLGDGGFWFLVRAGGFFGIASRFTANSAW